MDRLRSIRARRDEGMATSEYAVATVAACGFGGVLVKVLTSPQVMELVVGAIKKAFGFAF